MTLRRTGIPRQITNKTDAAFYQIAHHFAKNYWETEGEPAYASLVARTLSDYCLLQKLTVCKPHTACDMPIRFVNQYPIGSCLFIGTVISMSLLSRITLNLMLSPLYIASLCSGARSFIGIPFAAIISSPTRNPAV